MKHDNEQFNDYVSRLSEVKLSQSARTRIAGSLREYASFHPVRVTKQNRFIQQVPVVGPIIHFIKHPKSFMPALLITFMLLAGGSTSLAAQSTLPGDLLYPIKVDVNEKIVSAFALSDGAQASLQAKLAQERLEEAETLAAAGKLDADLSALLAAHIKSHEAKAEALSEKLEQHGDLKTSANVRATLEGTFRSYADVLSNLNVHVSGNNGVSLIGDINTYLTTHGDADHTASTSSDLSVELKTSIADTVAYADTAITRSQKSLEKIKGSVSAGAYAQMEAKLNSAIAAHTEATAALTAADYEEAYAEARTAIRLATQVETMAASAHNLQKQSTTLDLDAILKSHSKKDHVPAPDNYQKNNDDSNQGDDETGESSSENNKQHNVESSHNSDLNLDATLNTSLGL